MSEYSYSSFKRDFDEAMRGFVQTMNAFPWEDKACYAGWLAHSYSYVSHSTRLLALAAGRCNLDQQALHRRFIDHLAEEKGHEKLALADMKRLGFVIHDFEELSETSLFYQNQYFWLNFHGAIPFLGWILALEGGAVHACGAAYERVSKAHGKETGVFLRIHAEEDVTHLENALSQVRDLNPAELALVAKNLKQSSELYWSILRRIGGAIAKDAVPGEPKRVA